MYNVHGSIRTGYFAVDFTLAEVKSLRLRQRYDERGHAYNGLYQILTFDEYLTIATTGNRVVGIYPEIKNPVFINKHVKWEDGKVFEDKIIEHLLNHGFHGEYMSQQWLQKPIFIQSFAPLSIFHIANKTTSPKIFNIGPLDRLAEGTNVTYDEMITNSYLNTLAPHLLGVSINIAAVKNIIAKARSLGLQIHPFVPLKSTRNLDFLGSSDALIMDIKT